MRKTGSLFRFISIIVFFIAGLSATPIKAQEVTVTATLSENNIYAGEGVALNIEVSGREIGNFERPELPEIPGLQFLPGRTSQSTSYTFINNRPSTSVSYGFQFIAENTGKYEVPSITIVIKGETYKTRPIPFTVLDPADVNTEKADSSPDIYVRLVPNITNPVVGQQVIATIVLFFKSDIEVSSYQALPGWKAEGFWKEELDVQRQARTTSEIIGGVRYQRAELLNYAIFPTKPGKLELSPFPITVRLRQTRSRFMDPFGFIGGQEQKELATLPITLTVRNLPELSDADGIGAVGDFKISRTISNLSAFVGESIEIVTTITGTGNIPLINKPKYEYPQGLEQYNPQENTQTSRANKVISGTRTFTDIVIARNEGEFTIPEKTIGIYNADKNKYDYTTLPKITFNAVVDPKAFAGSDLIETRLNLKPQTGLANWESTSTDNLLQDRGILIWLAAPFLLLFAAFGYKKYLDKMATDSGFSRAQKARQAALDTLDQADKTTDIKQGYHLIQTALSRFIADKCNLPEAGLSTQRLMSEVKTKAPKTDLKVLQKLFDKCETIAYAPDVSQEGMHHDIESAKDQIKLLGKIL